jgi:DNA invertase Pin-like site-specific DNA recombinase
MIQMARAFAEFERSMIWQRIHAGLKRVVEQGETLGRPRTDAKTESGRRQFKADLAIR